MGSVKTCFVKFSTVFLFFINICVVLLGILCLGFGIWGATRDDDYITIAEDDDTNFNSIPILLIVVGVIILLLGATGLFGAIFGAKKGGRILLIMYAIAMTIVVLIAIGGGIAAYVERDEIEKQFRENTNGTFYRISFNDTKYFDAWDDAQKMVDCCGLTKWEDWLQVEWKEDESEVVPRSCCSGNCSNSTFYRPAEIENGDVKVWGEGCTQAVIDKAEQQSGIVAGVSLAVGIILVIAVLMAIFVAVVKRNKDSYEVV